MSSRPSVGVHPPRRLVVALVGLAAIAVIAPLAVVPMFALWDVPNHMVRLWVLLGFAKGTPVAAMYQPDWSLAWTNLGLDHLGMVLGQVLPFNALGPALISVTLLIVPFGLIALNRVLFGGVHAWHVGMFLLAWNFPVVGGLLSFQLGLGLALIAASLDVRIRHVAPVARFALRSVMAGAVMVTHVFGLMFLVLLLAGLAVGPRLSSLATSAGRRVVAIRMALAVAPCLLPAVALVLFAPRLPGAHMWTGAQFNGLVLAFPEWSLGERLSLALTPFKTYALVPDLLTLAVAAAIPLIALARWQLRLHGGLAALAVLLFVLAQFAPGTIYGTGWIEKRLPMMAALMMAAAIRPTMSRGGRRERLVAAVLAIAVLARAAFIAVVGIGQQAAIDDLRAVSAAIEPGSAVLVAEQFTGSVSDPRAPLGRYAHGEPIFRHLPTLLVIWRQAFVPTVFTAAGKQPLRVLPPWIEIAVPEGGLPHLDDLDKPAALRDFHYLADWRRRFHYLLVINADLPNAGRQIGDVAGIREVAVRPFARLYRIETP